MYVLMSFKNLKQEDCHLLCTNAPWTYFIQNPQINACFHRRGGETIYLHQTIKTYILIDFSVLLKDTIFIKRNGDDKISISRPPPSPPSHRIYIWGYKLQNTKIPSWYVFNGVPMGVLYPCSQMNSSWRDVTSRTCIFCSLVVE